MRATTAATVTTATDTAADSVDRLRDSFDDSKRAVAAAFVAELAALHNVTTNARTADGEVHDLGATFTTMGESAATATARAVVGVQILGRAAQVVIGGLAAPINALAHASSIEGVSRVLHCDAAHYEAQLEQQSLFHVDHHGKQGCPISHVNGVQLRSIEEPKYPLN